MRVVNSFFNHFFLTKKNMQGGRLRYDRPGVQLRRGLGGVLRGMGKMASAALRGDMGPIVKSLIAKPVPNYGKRKAKNMAIRALTGGKRKKKENPPGIKRRKKKLSDIFSY